MSLNTSHAFCHVFLNFNKSNDLVTLPVWERFRLFSLVEFVSLLHIHLA